MVINPYLKLHCQLRRHLAALLQASWKLSVVKLSITVFVVLVGCVAHEHLQLHRMNRIANNLIEQAKKIVTAYPLLLVHVENTEDIADLLIQCSGGMGRIQLFYKITEAHPAVLAATRSPNGLSRISGIMVRCSRIIVSWQCDSDWKRRNRVYISPFVKCRALLHCLIHLLESQRRMLTSHRCWYKLYMYNIQSTKLNWHNAPRRLATVLCFAEFTIEI